MKIYEKPLVNVKTFDIEDVMTESGNLGADSTEFQEIAGNTNEYQGVIVEW